MNRLYGVLSYMDRPEYDFIWIRFTDPSLLCEEYEDVPVINITGWLVAEGPHHFFVASSYSGLELEGLEAIPKAYTTEVRLMEYNSPNKKHECN